MYAGNSMFSGLKTVLKLAVPLMLTWLSTTLMMFVDRFLLAQYSLEALGAAVNAGTIAWGLGYGIQIITEMAQVVVAQYNGAERKDKLAAPVWQVLWIACGSVVLFAPLSIWGADFFFASNSLQALYFRWLIAFGSAFALIGAGSAYFIGVGRGKMVTVSAVIGNGINLLLDWLLIFGVDGYLEPMGILGAAIASGIGLTVQGLILVTLFLRDTQFTVCPVRWQELYPCVRVGLPTGVFIAVEFIGWGMFYSLMVAASKEHILVTSICQTMLPLFACVGIGLQKAIASLSGNLIGARQLDRIPYLLRSGLVILIAYFTVLIGSLALYPQPVLSLFLEDAPMELAGLHTTLYVGLILSCVYLGFGGIRLILSGVLSAAGDTMFIMVAGSLSVWILLLLPIYLVVNQGGASVTTAQALLAVYGLVTALIYWIRFVRGGWRTKCQLIKDGG